MIERFISFYNLSYPHCVHTMSDIWKMVTGNHQSRLHNALMTSDTSLIKEVLDKCSIYGILYGIENAGPISGEMLSKRLLCLAVSIGIIPMHNPEQPSNIKPSVDIASLIEDQIGVSMKIPKCFGYENKDGFPARLICYMDAWNSIEMIHYPRTIPEAILEIGGGIGMLGYIAMSKKVRRYTVIDLPIVSIINAYFASHYCGKEKIWMYGEANNPEAFARYYPSTHYDLPENDQYDVVFNSDSFPEIKPDIQDAYLKLIHRVLKPNGRFLSINHESNNGGQRRVYEACKIHGGFDLVQRSPWQMRPGYIKEVWTKV